jgi:integrase/recombinase XerD
LSGRPKGTGGKAEELTSDEIHRIDKCLTGTRHEHRNRALFYLGLGSGMRVSELAGLRVRDVAPHGQVLSRVILEKHSTKSGKSRTVAISKQAIKRLGVYLEQRSLPIDPDAPLFPSQKRPTLSLSPTNAVMALKKMFLDAGVANASSHSLRRTHANTLRRHGADLMIIKEQLGHSSLSTTQRYFQTDPIEVQEAVNRLNF